MKFITTDSELSFDNAFLNIQKIKQDPEKRYWVHSFILLALFIGLQTERAIYDKQRALVWVVIGLIWIYPHLKRIFNILFVEAWSNRIKLEQIQKIAVLPTDNALETRLCMMLSSGRQKHLVFRNAENQMDDFLVELNKRTNCEDAAKGKN